MNFGNFTPAKLGLVKKDIANVRENALVVITIAPDNSSFKLQENPRGRLSVLAVIGPTEVQNRFLKEALLLEVGLGPGRPYHQARGLRCVGRKGKITKRRKWFILSREQYLLVAPLIFGYIKKRAQDQVAQRKSFFWWLPVSTNTFYYDSGTTNHYNGRKQKRRGARFTACREDRFLIADILWVEIQQVKTHLAGLTNYISKVVGYYRPFQRYKGVKPFGDLKAVSEILDNLSRQKSMTFPLHAYLMDVVLEDLLKRESKLQKSQQRSFRGEIHDVFAPFAGGHEEKKCLKHYLLLEERKRLEGLEIRIAWALTDNHRDHISFELFPFQDEEEWKKHKEKLARQQAAKKPLPMEGAPF